RFIGGRIEDWITRGGGPSDVGVLYRSNAQSRAIEEALLRSSIPYRIYGGLRFFERAEIKDALAYMKLVSDVHSDPAFERGVNGASRGIGDRTVEAIRARAREAGVSMWQASKDGFADGTFKGRSGAAIYKLIQRINRFGVGRPGMGP